MNGIPVFLRFINDLPNLSKFPGVAKGRMRHRRAYGKGCRACRQAGRMNELSEYRVQL